MAIKTEICPKDLSHSSVLRGPPSISDSQRSEALREHGGPSVMSITSYSRTQLPNASTYPALDPAYKSQEYKNAETAVLAYKAGKVKELVLGGVNFSEPVVYLRSVAAAVRAEMNARDTFIDTYNSTYEGANKGQEKVFSIALQNAGKDRMTFFDFVRQERAAAIEQTRRDSFNR